MQPLPARTTRRYTRSTSVIPLKGSQPLYVCNAAPENARTLRVIMRRDGFGLSNRTRRQQRKMYTCETEPRSWNGVNCYKNRVLKASIEGSLIVKCKSRKSAGRRLSHSKSGALPGQSIAQCGRRYSANPTQLSKAASQMVMPPDQASFNARFLVVVR
ncbi:uncharacterized protein EI90DRAFT_3056520 [Cantharellus anzutake]|uniref:uncharacterized protein n=1 Tax=Cantharellus anzutake TaxID=1750568 RepID=UPI001907D381|nr:uncharacterized protein EI90DRAFT_3056520 [Cantharellus anzutake]KAF8332090.1 hypothetical protein EI90DRAFT_3056520 [Cantharellus anzutake]